MGSQYDPNIKIYNKYICIKNNKDKINQNATVE